LPARGARDPPFVVPLFQQTRRVGVLLVARARAPRLEDGARRNATHTTTRHQKLSFFFGRLSFLSFLSLAPLFPFFLSLARSLFRSFFLSLGLFYRRGLNNAKTKKQKKQNRKTTKTQKTKKQKSKKQENAEEKETQKREKSGTQKKEKRGTEKKEKETGYQSSLVVVRTRATNVRSARIKVRRSWEARPPPVSVVVTIPRRVATLCGCQARRPTHARCRVIAIGRKNPPDGTCVLRNGHTRIFFRAC
jgi:hypothetical protein